MVPSKLPRTAQKIIYCFNFSSFRSVFNAADLLYFLPPYRFTSYAIGILLGIFLRKFEDFKLTRNQRFFGNFLSAFCGLLTCLIIVWNWEFSFFAQACYSAFASVTYTLIFVWFILLAKSGSQSEFKKRAKANLSFSFPFSDFFVKFLEWKFFKFASNIAFSIYVIQFTVFNYNIAIKRSANTGSIYTTIVRFSIIKFT